MPKPKTATKKVVEETLALYERVERGDFQTKLPYPERNDPEYKSKRAAYGADEGRLIEEFKSEMFREYGVSDNPKRDLCWQKAWEHGHAAGLSEVHTYFQDFVELIQ